MAEKKARGVGGCKVWGAKRDCFGFRFSPFRFPGLGPTQEGPWPVHVSCVETFTQFSFHLGPAQVYRGTPGSAPARPRRQRVWSAVNMGNRATFKV